MREAAIIDNGALVNVIVIADGAQGDAMLSDSCVEITDVDPKPALGQGWVYSDGGFVPPAPLPATWDDVRAERNELLVNSDWTQNADAPLSDEDRSRWAVYRQSLRDVPQSSDSPDDVVWPAKPSSRR